MPNPYADIHHFDGTTPDLDDDGDQRFGWYFQIMETTKRPLSVLIGPYTRRDECEQAAQEEWAGLPA